MSNRSFQKSDQKSERSFALSKRAIALSLFQKQRQKERSLFRSFKKSERTKMSEKMSYFPNRSFFAQKKEQSLIFKMNKCLTLQLQGWAIAHSLIAHFRLFKRANERQLFSALFAKEQMSNLSFLLFSKEQLKERSLFRSFKKSDQKSDRSFALSKRATKRAIALSLFHQVRKSKNERMPNPGFSVLKSFYHEQAACMSLASKSGQLVQF